MKRSKNYLNAVKQIDKKKIYSTKDGVELIKKINQTKFDASIDIAIKLNIDPSKTEQQLRGTVSLPHYYGKKIKILAITDEISNEEAEKLEIKVGQTDVIKEIKDEQIYFDLIITTPKFMPSLSKLGKILGPKGLMPNPKLGTVTTNILKTINEFKKGKYQYRTDTYGNIHMKIGKISAPTNDIVENIDTLISFIKSKKPATVKGEYIKNITISSTMSPSVKLVK